MWTTRGPRRASNATAAHEATWCAPVSQSFTLFVVTAMRSWRSMASPNMAPPAVAAAAMRAAALWRRDRSRAPHGQCRANRSGNTLQQPLSLLNDRFLVRQQPLSTHVLKHWQERIGALGAHPGHLLDDGQ